MSEAAGALSPGSRIAGRYEVQGRAGEHPAFVRWRARERGDEVELWSVRRDLFAAPDAAVKFVDDVLESRRLADSHLRRPRDAALVDSTLIVVMTPEGLVPEMLSSRDPASDADLLGLARALASGLGAAHSVGLVHGRLIPADLVEEGARIKVGGVGMWSQADPHAALEHWQPYRRFLAPEVAAGQAPTDRSDVLASAAILAAAAVGASAESAGDVRELHDAVAARRPDVAIALAEAFDASPERRPESVALLVERLDECFSGSPGRPAAVSPLASVSAAPPGPPPIPGDASSRRIPALPMPVGARRKLAGVGARAAGFEHESETKEVPTFEPPAAARRGGDSPSARTPAATASAPRDPAPDVHTSAPAIHHRRREAPPGPAEQPERARSLEDSQAHIETSAFVRAYPGAEGPAADHGAPAADHEAPKPSAAVPREPSVISDTPPIVEAPPADHTPPIVDPPPPDEVPLVPPPPAQEAEEAEFEPSYGMALPMSKAGSEAGSGRDLSRPLFPVPASAEDERKPLGRRLLWAAAAVGIAGIVLVVALVQGGSEATSAAKTRSAAAPPGAGDGSGGGEAPAGQAAERGPAGAENAPDDDDDDDDGDDGDGNRAPEAAGQPAGVAAAAGPAQPAVAAAKPDVRSLAGARVEPLGPCPAGMVQLSKRVCIDVYEAPGGGRAPTVGVTLAEARAACAARDARLCSGSEWERACRGDGGASYPYGPAFRPAPCNVSGDIAAAGAFPDCASRVGAFDMAGNVAEWASNGRARGGSALDRHQGRCSKADARDPDRAHDDVGYRCCADAD